MVPSTPLGSKDLGPGDFVNVECAACGQDMLFPASALLQGLSAPANLPCARLGTTARVPRVRCARQGDGFDQMGSAGGIISGSSGANWTWTD
jgi:hypothetical protein